jgi:hypothetical protein
MYTDTRGNTSGQKNMYTDRRGNTSGQESHAEAERKLKYKSLCIEVKLLWKMKCMITPVITRIVTKSFKQILKPQQENIQQAHYKTQLSLNIMHNTGSAASEIRGRSSGDLRRFRGRSTKKKRYVIETRK